MMKDNQTNGSEKGFDEDVMAPVWCYECKKQFSFKMRAGASQKKLPARERDRLVGAALNASNWQMLAVVGENGEETGLRPWFCESCVDQATREFEKLRAEAKKPWRRPVR